MKVDEMVLLVRVAETGSMTHAARQLHLTPAAVSAAVLRIENAIGVKIFERTTRFLHPTDKGMVIIESCRELAGSWQRILDDVREEKAAVKGSVHLSAPADTTYQILEDIVVSTSEAHPQLQIVLHTSDTVQHLHRDAIDMAIRYGPLQDSSLMARKLSECKGVLVASPSYLAASGYPETPESLKQHRCLTLQLSNAPQTSWCLYQGEESHIVHINSPLCGDGYLTRKWAIAGVGIAYKSLFDVIDDLEAGRLIRVLPTFDLGLMEIHAVFPSRRFLPARVRVLTDAITEHFARRNTRCQEWLSP